MCTRRNARYLFEDIGSRRCRQIDVVVKLINFSVFSTWFTFTISLVDNWVSLPCSTLLTPFSSSKSEASFFWIWNLLSLSRIFRFFLQKQAPIWALEDLSAFCTEKSREGEEKWAAKPREEQLWRSEPMESLWSRSLILPSIHFLLMVWFLSSLYLPTMACDFTWLFFFFVFFFLCWDFHFL